MSGLEFASHLVWPVFALVIVLVFYRPIHQWLERNTQRLKAGPFEIEWERVIADTEKEIGETTPAIMGSTAPAEASVRSELTREAQVAPTVAVLEAHATVERELRAIVGDEDPERTSHMSAVGLARLANHRGLITDEAVRAVEGISVLRNLAAHSGGCELTPQQAAEYMSLVDAVRFALSRATPG